MKEQSGGSGLVAIDAELVTNVCLTLYIYGSIRWYCIRCLQNRLPATIISKHTLSLCGESIKVEKCLQKMSHTQHIKRLD